MGNKEILLSIAIRITPTKEFKVQTFAIVFKKAHYPVQFASPLLKSKTLFKGFALTSPHVPLTASPCLRKRKRNLQLAIAALHIFKTQIYNFLHATPLLKIRP